MHMTCTIVLGRNLAFNGQLSQSVFAVQQKLVWLFELFCVFTTVFIQWCRKLNDRINIKSLWVFSKGREKSILSQSFKAIIGLFKTNGACIETTDAESVVKSKKLQIFSPQWKLFVGLCFTAVIDQRCGVLLHCSWSGKTACHCWTGWRISSSTPCSESYRFSSTGCSVKKQTTKVSALTTNDSSNLPKFRIDKTETILFKAQQSLHNINRTPLRKVEKGWNKSFFVLLM